MTFHLMMTISTAACSVLIQCDAPHEHNSTRLDEQKYSHQCNVTKKNVLHSNDR